MNIIPIRRNDITRLLQIIAIANPRLEDGHLTTITETLGGAWMAGSTHAFLGRSDIKHITVALDPVTDAKHLEWLATLTST